MTPTKTLVVRLTIAVILAIGLSGLVYPAAPLCVGLGFFIGIGQFMGSSDPMPLVGAALMLGGLVLTAAPIILVVLAIRPPRSVAGWVRSAVFLVLTGVFLYVGIDGSFIKGWFRPVS